MSESKIDIVLTWVDGSDPEWINVRNETCPDQPIADSQYRDWGLLKYWFRGIEKFAPWVNKVYFVTWGHVPDFLNINHPKLQVVYHSDYIPQEYLPTFSSHVIELNLHRISGLSEKFIYFNDDTYIINKTVPEDFFVDGLPRDVAIQNPIVPANYNTISGVMMNDISIINQNFSIRDSIKNNKSKWFSLKYGKLNLLNLMFLPWKKSVGLYQQHLPASMLKSTYREVWEKESDILNQTSLNRVRNIKEDVNQWLFKEWQIMKGSFYPRSISFGKYTMLQKSSDVLKIKKAFHQSNVKALCINDHIEDDENINKIVSELDSLFKTKLPDKSEFEL